MASLAFSRSGSGPTLVLLPGMGFSHAVWNPVVPELAGHFDVVALDLPGFGDSPALPPGTEPTPARLASSVAAFLDELGVDRPHLVGNSLGGWVALELAAVRPAASLTLLSPAGLWRHHTPLYTSLSLRLSRWVCRRAAGLLYRLVAFRAGRVLVLGQSHGRPWRMTADQAHGVVRDLHDATAFEAGMAATTHRSYGAGPPLGAPVTVVFGSRDLILLPRRSRHLDQLPPGTYTAELAGCGHVPMADDPAAVSALVLAATTRVAPGRTLPA